MLTAEFSWTVV